jgi:hypothetical protein
MFDDKPKPPRNFANPGNGCEAALHDEIVPPLWPSKTGPPAKLFQVTTKSKASVLLKSIAGTSLACPAFQGSEPWRSMDLHSGPPLLKNLNPENLKGIQSIQRKKVK